MYNFFLNIYKMYNNKISDSKIQRSVKFSFKICISNLFSLSSENAHCSTYIIFV